ncbi:MAG: hypothetical protein BA863_07780 [Desulfovibrio sp. S3730MH75]|nr:MAG: hypothetical protein BA863_07780 [Desulfovibrio sp. S3730MH75]
MNHKREIPLNAGKLEGRYANYFKVGHNAFEFVIEFSQFYPESEEAELHTRIITSPVYAKGLLEILRDSIKRYEQSFGAISKDDEKGVVRSGVH